MNLNAIVEKFLKVTTGLKKIEESLETTQQEIREAGKKFIEGILVELSASKWIVEVRDDGDETTYSIEKEWNCETGYRFNTDLYPICELSINRRGNLTRVEFGGRRDPLEFNFKTTADHGELSDALTDVAFLIRQLWNYQTPNDLLSRYKFLESEELSGQSLKEDLLLMIENKVRDTMFRSGITIHINNINGWKDGEEVEVIQNWRTERSGYPSTYTFHHGNEYRIKVIQKSQKSYRCVIECKRDSEWVLLTKQWRKRVDWQDIPDYSFEKMIINLVTFYPAHFRVE